ncbi:discoidin domain-containing protein, partial [Anaerobaca lacustris]|nr:discoidin domain-containing protein [Sedimentisphaerales bacterium M17dextr]
MRRHIVLVSLLVCLAISPIASAAMVHQEWWTGVGASRQAIIDFLGDLANPVPTPDYEGVLEESRFVGSRDNYVAKFYGWVTVPVTGTYQFHYACDDYGMLYVSQDEEMANAVEVAWVDGWTNIAEWNKYPTQHSEPMELRQGQVMAVMAFFQEAGGGDNMDIGWTGPAPLSSDITNPTYLTDYITNIPPTPTKAKSPSPEDGAIDVPRDVVLGWAAGKFAATHDVYLGTAFDDVNDATRADPRGVLVSQGQAATTYDPPGLLDFNTTYYWRIDEVNAPPSNTIYDGKIWSFTTEPFAYPVPSIIATTSGISEAGSGPEKTIDGSGINAADEHSTEASDMWLALPGDEPLYVQYEFDRIYKLHEMLVWNYNVQFELLLGFGIKDVTVEYSVDGEEWTVLGDVSLAQATARATYVANTTVPFDGVPVKYVRLNVNSGHGPMGQFGLSEVRFLYIPAQAREPQPGDAATRVEVGSALSWRAGRDAASHEVYLGTDPNELALAGTVAGATF